MTYRKGDWICEFCHKVLPQGQNLPNTWELVLQSAICPECWPRVQQDGGINVVKCGAYATTPDPREPKDIVEILEETNPGKHISVLHGDKHRVGVRDRWSWSCRCGSGSKRADMRVEEAYADFAEHEREG